MAVVKYFAVYLTIGKARSTLNREKVRAMIVCDLSLSLYLKRSEEVRFGQKRICVVTRKGGGARSHFLLSTVTGLKAKLSKCRTMHKKGETG